MFTQCPECQVYFRITPAQLEARHGLVRCGECAAVFQANDKLLDGLPPTSKPFRDPKPHTPRPSAKKKRRRKLTPPEDSDSLPPELAAPLLFPAPPRHTRWRFALWLTASLPLAMLALVQIVYLNRIELAEYPSLRPPLAAACKWLGCVIERAHNVSRIEFETSIAPHPKFANALRLRADLVNRGDRAQPYPVLEVTLTDSNGQTLSRRQFEPGAFLGGKSGDRSLPPNIVAHVLLDITNPDNRAVGYEVRLLPGE